MEVLSVDDEELERLKQQRMVELRRQAAAEEAKVRAESEKQALLRVILTPEARLRLSNIKMVRPEFAEQLERQLIQLAQSGRVPAPLTDQQLKELLRRLTSTRKDITIRRI
ncbi:DNA-binding protein [Candidatus Hecatella orcuttiae]|jgi:programmed cell death protein 5|uniref:DNA-binding protein n=1 Tax=Candidatus Hecatella orcuttiae TaxID=1935119 RepID=UPI002867C5B8|nr:DNA-binding protein [Candidatus Hecatella orcuttiae]